MTGKVNCLQCNGTQYIKTSKQVEVFDEMDVTEQIPVYKTEVCSVVVSREPIYDYRMVPKFKNEPIYKEKTIKTTKQVAVYSYANCDCKQCNCINCLYCTCEVKKRSKYNYYYPLIKTFMKFHFARILFLYFFPLLTEFIYLNIAVFVFSGNQIFFIGIMTVVTIFFEIFFIVRYRIYNHSKINEIMEYKSFFSKYEYESLP